MSILPARAPRTRLRLGAALVAAALVAVPAASAQAAGTAGGNWWYDRFGVAQVQAEGWTGVGIKVAVLDKQINDTLPVFAGTSLSVIPDGICSDPVTSTDATEDSTHGSDMAAYLIGNGEGQGSVRGIAPDVDLTFYGYGPGFCVRSADGNGNISGGGYADAVRRAIADGNRVISTSTGSIPSENPAVNTADAAAIAEAMAAGVIVVASTPNSATDTANMPSVLNGVVSVNAFDAEGNLNADTQTGAPNIWPEATVVGPGVGFASVNWQQESTTSGASNATPLVAGILALTWQKYPAATANQLIQSLIHNTTAEDHPLTRDTTGGYGYGPVSLRHMLEVDPTQYPDENPLMDKSSGLPTAEQVATAAAAGTTPPPSSAEPSSSGQPVAAESAGVEGWIIGGVVAIIALVVVIVLVARRKTRSTQGGTR